MSPAWRRVFGWGVLALWACSLALPAYYGRGGAEPGIAVLFVGPLGLIGHSPVPPGSSLGWFANGPIVFLGVQLARGRRAGWVWAALGLGLAAAGAGPTDLGFDTTDPSTPGSGQAAWLAAAGLAAAAAVVDRLVGRAEPTRAPVSPHDAG